MAKIQLCGCGGVGDEDLPSAACVDGIVLAGDSFASQTVIMARLFANSECETVVCVEARQKTSASTLQFIMPWTGLSTPPDYITSERRPSCGDKPPPQTRANFRRSPIQTNRQPYLLAPSPVTHPLYPDPDTVSVTQYTATISFASQASSSSCFAVPNRKRSLATTATCRQTIPGAECQYLCCRSGLWLNAGGPLSF
ncbi:hypothetical protein SODALDRAFT_355545 [Sodiomyces alkalinus F11]|uniref:Uncharacterized protein n=1 Tax=Sodiomyces alkalinus (strain CBS 110278 / VKM F-3762 / F11) TaxID=1314773 RepID=A0A3N2Q9K6_SODAK|nr:hypothetical protein SODALDRAFT_355545 [Sodiomyces alkalinus F11]ROT43338.1 hypothetical protein SODALDRAFT_355545 [Sodiomyces alkalinus F11]